MLKLSMQPVLLWDNCTRCQQLRGAVRCPRGSPRPRSCPCPGQEVSPVPAVPEGSRTKAGMLQPSPPAWQLEGVSCGVKVYL